MLLQQRSYYVTHIRKQIRSGKVCLYEARTFKGSYTGKGQVGGEIH